MTGQLAVSLGKKAAVPTTVSLLMMTSTMVASPMVTSRSAFVKAGRGIHQYLS